MPRAMTELSSVNKPASSYLNKDPDKDDITVISDTLLAACLSPVLYPRIAFDRKSFAEKTSFPEFRICSIEKLQFGRTSHTRAAGSFLDIVPPTEEITCTDV